jgi:hypothetical protein
MKLSIIIPYFETYEYTKEYVYFYNNGRPGSITTGGEPE